MDTEQSFDYEAAYHALRNSIHSKNNVNRDYPYPENLLMALGWGADSSGDGEPIVLLYDLPADFAGTLEYVLYSLTERERKIIEEQKTVVK